MGEREKGTELIGRGELFFPSHPGKEEIFSGYGLTEEEGSKGNPVGLLIVDRPRPVNLEWLRQVDRNFGEYQLVSITATGEQEIVCRKEIEQERHKHLRQISTEKADAIRKALKPLLDNRPQPKFNLSWKEDRRLWQSRMTAEGNLI